MRGKNAVFEMSRVRASSKLSSTCQLIIAVLFSRSEFSGSACSLAADLETLLVGEHLLFSPLFTTPLNFLSQSLFISPSDKPASPAVSIISSISTYAASVVLFQRGLHSSLHCCILFIPPSLCSLFDLLPFSLVFLFMYVVSLGLLLCTALSKSINKSGYCGSHSECLVRPCGRRAGLQIYQRTPTQACLSSVITCYWQHRFSNSFFSGLGFSFLDSPHMKKWLLWPRNTV